MKPARIVLGAVVLIVGTAAGAAPASIAAMKWQRRVLLVSSPDAADPMLARQRRVLRDWRQGAAARDLSLVDIAGSKVAGAGDTAAMLRRRYRLDAGAFEVVLIGKDGRVALRSARPIAAQDLADAIDAMPMRRAGER